MNPLRLGALGVVGAISFLACGDASPDPGVAAPSTTTTAPPTDAVTALTASTTAPATTAPATTAPATTAPADLGAALPGRTFVSTAVEGFTLVDGTQISLTFDTPALAANAGCNTLTGAWAVEGDVLATSGGLAQTEMACDPPALMDQDTWLSSVLTSRPTLTLDGDTLTITAQGATVTLVAAT